MTFLDYLVDNNKIIYCANSLFSPLSRIGGYNIASAIEDCIKSKGMKYRNYKFTFLPFKDTQQSDIKGENKAHKIYELDIQKLQNSGAIIGRLDGIAKDSGVCMELGYAYALGIPIGIFSTDFIWEGFPSHTNKEDLDFDSILMCIATYSKHFTQTPTSSEYYSGQNQMLEIRMVSEFTESCLNEFEKLQNFKNAPVLSQSGNTGVYIDIQGGKFEWSMQEQNTISQKLTSVGLEPTCATRYQIHSTKDKDIIAQSKNDLQNLLQSKLAVFSADNIEMDAGSAALFGISVGLKIKTVLLYTSPTVLKGAGGQEMKLNLMIEQAADLVCSSKDELYDKLKTLI
ncbi:MAG: nucleoside 2-deoxyribosyltransferase [Flavobacteriales bacterium]|nr:nucleoside 2-deoxyribosyltransferase [Flavobacteriales bacterium]